MPSIHLKYGQTSIPFEYDASLFDVLAAPEQRLPLTDVQINEKLDNPIDSAPLEEMVKPGDSVLLVVPDATRTTAAGQIVNLLVRRLIANGSASHDIRIIFATGIHRKVTDAEKDAILTPFIAQRIKTLDHDARDLARIIRVGETSGGIPVEVDRALTEHDHVVLVGGVTFHYFAGFTGGRKLICPGLASARTVAATHKLAFDCETHARREGVDTGLLDGNGVHEAFMEAVALVDPRFAVSTIVDDRGEVVDVFCGDWRTSHRAACDAYAGDHMIEVAEKRGLVIASCGGAPHDINMIQAHKTLDAASRACNPGGTIFLLAECGDGLGRDDFLDWFAASDSIDLAQKLCEKYQVNGQTAWSLLRKAEQFRIRVISDLSADTLDKMRLQNADPSDLQTLATTPGYIIPTGAKIAITAKGM